jgi:hypothetical protein
VDHFLKKPRVFKWFSHIFLLRLQLSAGLLAAHGTQPDPSGCVFSHEPWGFHVFFNLDNEHGYDTAMMRMEHHGVMMFSYDLIMMNR